MKIEIAESLIYSYLKHIEGCRIVQTNWTTSGKWTITDFETENAKRLFDKLSESDDFSEIFKKSSFNQLIKQAEIDVIGINTAESSVFGIDVAFHSSGLNYGSKEETALRVVKKIFRTIFIMQCYFNENEKFNSFFISPKVNPATKILIDELIAKAKEVLEDQTISIVFISDDEFYRQIVDPILENTDDEHDTGELFSRAVKLLKLDSRKKVSSTKARNELKNPGNSISKRTVNGMKIGQFVRYSFRKAFELNLITESEINMLQDFDYSKETFNSNFEVLKNTLGKIKDENGISRYYARELFCGNYHLTSQWFEPQWDYFLLWLNKIGFDYGQNAI